jgi:predicted permease
MSMHDLRQALRSFVRNPGFSVTVVVILAIGIGAVTAIFSIVNGVLLRPLPYPESGRLVVISNSFGEVVPNESSYLDALEYQRRTTSFESMAMMLTWDHVTLTGLDIPERIDASFVSHSYFNLVGVKPALGRTFLPQETATPGNDAVAVLSHDLWQNRFGSDRGVVGRTVRLNGHPFQVVGVLPRGYKDVSDGTQVFLPITMVQAALNRNWLENRDSRILSLLSLLKPGVSLAQAQEEMEGVTRQLAAEYPDTNKGYGAYIRTLFDFIYSEERGIENVRQSILVLALASAFVLLIACVNVGILFLVRAANRRQEFGVRLALGVSRSQMTRQLLAESLLLTLTGSALGVLIAHWCTRSLLAVGDIDLPDFVRVSVDGEVLGLVLLLSALTGLGFGLVPAMASARVDLRNALQGSGKQQGAGTGGIGRSLLVVTEVALAVLLLVGAGLMIRSFQLLHSTGIGFDTEKLLTLRITLSGEKYAEELSRVQLAERLQEQVRRLPGVEVAGTWGSGTPGGGGGYIDVSPEERPSDRPEDAVRATNHHISPGTLTALGIPILRGRDIGTQDTADTPLVAVISESLAKSLWPNQDALDRRFTGGGFVLTVVGIVKDVRHGGRLLVEDRPPRDFYVSYAQRPVRALGMYVLTSSPPETLANPLRQIMKSLDPDLAVYDIKTARERFAEEEAQTRMTALLMGFYAAVSMLLACLGIYSVLAYSVSRRTNEIGIRMALGARHGDIYRLIVGQAMILVLAGIAVGVFGALALTRIMVSLLYGVAATDVRTFVAVVLGFVVVALLASWWPARRAARIQPVTALRYD